LGRSESRPPALIALGVVVGLEALAVAGIAVLVILSALSSSAAVGSGIAAGLTVLITAALLAFVAAGTFRARPWTRAATFVWQLVQLLVGAYAFQGTGAAVGFGLAAVVPAAVGLVLLFLPSVRAATARP
jgi:hypothetical protein